MHELLVRWRYDTHAIVGGKLVGRKAGDEDLLPQAEARSLVASGVVAIVAMAGRVGLVDTPTAPKPKPYLRCPYCNETIDPAALDVPLECDACGGWYVQVQPKRGTFAVAATLAPQEEADGRHT